MSWAARWRQRRPRLLQLWGVGVAAALLVTAASARGALEGLQARSLDLLMWLQGPREPAGVVIVAIDDAAFESLGRQQPIPREYLAQVLRGVERAGAAVVGIDISLASPPTPAADAALAEAIRGFADGRRRVVLLDPLSAGGPLGAR